jgi:hypothetical protein
MRRESRFHVRKHPSRDLSVLLVGALAAAMLTVATPATAAQTVTQSFGFTGAAQSWRVPDGVSALSIDAFGGQGTDRGPRGAGGRGAEETGIVSVSPGDVLQIDVGGQGGQPDVRDGGWNGGGNGGHQGGPAGNDGGGGGGASDVYDLTAHRWLMVAGGGGGGGGDEAGAASGGQGGNGGPDGADATENGAPGGTPAGCSTASAALGGRGGGNGGVGGRGEICGLIGGAFGSNGVSGQAPPVGAGGGGADSNCCIGGGGGGGGGGYLGGGGGGGADSGIGGGGGGGGGSSFGGTTTGQLQTGNGRIQISFIEGTSTTTTVTASPTPQIFGAEVTFTATVSPVPTGGTVQFTVDGTKFGSPVAIDTSTGTATSQQTSTLSVGAHAVVAAYSGISDFSTSTGFAASQGRLTIQVQPDTDPPTVTVIAPTPPAGQNGYFNIDDLTDVGGAITLTVTASDTSGTVTNVACNDNGSQVTVAGQAGSNPRRGTVSLSTNGTHAISCTATDSAGNSGNNAGANTATVKIDTTAPTLTVPQSPVTVNATDPTGTDVAAYPISSSDPDPGDDRTITCTPPAPHHFGIGDTTVSCQATDHAGNTSSAGQFIVRVQDAGPQLVDLHAAVQGVGPGKSLATTVERAQRQLASGHPRGAGETLDHFIAEVNAQRGKTIPATQADHLIADAHRIQTVLGYRPPGA